jgi:MFS family permease
MRETAARPIPLWRNTSYLLLFGGQAISVFGSGISQLAFPLLILALTHSAAAAGFAAALERLPYVLVSLPAGALVDRWDRRRVLLVCNACMGLGVASIAVALALGRLTLAQIYVVSFVNGVFGVFFGLAMLGALTYVVSREQIGQTVAVGEATYSTTQLAAPSLSGVLFGLGQLLPFAADALSYLVAVVGLLGIHRPLQGGRQPTQRNLWAEMRDGITWLWHHTLLLALTALTGYQDMLIFGSTLIVIVVAQSRHVSPAAIGLIFGAGGVGNMLGTVVATPLERRMGRRGVMAACVAAYVLTWPLFALAGSAVALAAIFTALAFTDSTYHVVLGGYRLGAVPDALQGRVNSAYRLVVFGFIAAGQAVIGVLLQRLGPPHPPAPRHVYRVKSTYMFLISV